MLNLAELGQFEIAQRSRVSASKSAIRSPIFHAIRNVKEQPRRAGANAPTRRNYGRLPAETDVRVATDRHENPTLWSALGVDEERQLTGALLRQDGAEERVIRTMPVVLHGAGRRGSILEP